MVFAGVSHSSIYEKADTSKADVKAIDINQKLAGQSQERGSIPLLYSCTAPELQGGLCDNEHGNFEQHTYKA